MNRKGLTLIELMAVIAIIAILTIMIMPGIMSVRSSVLESTYKNKLSQIVAAGKDYGTEHITELKSPVSEDYNGTEEASGDCIYRTVNFLISNGYLKVSNSYASSADNTSFIDPRTGQAMNNRSVCIRFDNNDVMTRQVIAYLVKELEE